jgi:small subunit ribosomal protein S21|tara:strand:- start:883 stop:1086 length:204 start_codon:yes stop_codon:yes gene_type:complete
MATNIKVKVRKGEDVNKAIRRFKKMYEAEGVLKDIKRKRYYMKPSEAKKYKRIMAAKKRKKAARRRK